MCRETNKMKKALLGILFLELVMVSPVSTMAGINVDINIGIPLPPAIVFSSPPALIVLPETYVYVAPDVDVDIFFYDGWWWRPWDGRWYRSHDYSSGWTHFNNVPSFYRGIPSDWRNDYREHRWKGHQWDHQRIPHSQVQRNWRNWEKNKHWEKQKNWGVKDLQPRQSRPQLKGVQPQHSQQHRKAVKPQHSQQQKGHHEKEHGGKKGK
ncbi:MAG: hypothetical protein PHZ02_04405 [Desulfocapsaceae bacterium]|nr:hypothetical protein [Desulfocapsaceae bacterium]